MDALVRPSIADGRGRPSYGFVLGQVLSIHTQSHLAVDFSRVAPVSTACHNRPLVLAAKAGIFAVSADDGDFSRTTHANEGRSTLAVFQPARSRIHQSVHALRSPDEPQRRHDDARRARFGRTRRGRT